MTGMKDKYLFLNHVYLEITCCVCETKQVKLMSLILSLTSDA